MGERILVTGANGFIGRAVMKWLNADFDLLGVDIGETGVTEAPYVSLDLREYKAVYEVLTTFRPQTIINLGALAKVGEASDANVLMLHNLLLGCVAVGARIQFIQAGSAAEYGDIGMGCEPATEDSPTPFSDDSYAKSKIMCSNLLRGTLAELNHVTIFRFANVYGPGQTNRIIPYMIKAVAEGREFKLNGRGRPQRQYVYIDDVANAIARAVVLKIRSRGIFNIGANPEIYLGGLANMVATEVHAWQLAHGITPTPAAFTLGDGDGGAMRVAVNFSKADRELVWQPKVSLVKGLRRTVDHQLSTTGA